MGLSRSCRGELEAPTKQMVFKFYYQLYLRATNYVNILKYLSGCWNTIIPLRWGSVLAIFCCCDRTPWQGNRRKALFGLQLHRVRCPSPSGREHGSRYGRHDTGAAAENSHSDPQKGSREHTWNGMSLLKPPNPTPSGTPPPIRPYFLILPKEFHQVGTTIGTYEPIQASVIETTTGPKLLNW